MANILMLVALITGYTPSIMYTSTVSLLFPRWLNAIILGIAILVVYCNLGFLILTKILSTFHVCCADGKCFQFLINIFKHNVMNEEDQALLRSHRDND